MDLDPRIEANIAACQPKNDHYLTARVLGHMDKVYGQRGTTAIAFYTYFRWLDNIVDGPGDKNTKIGLLDRQKQVISGVLPANPHPLEEQISQIDLSFLSPETEKLLRLQAQILLGSEYNDVEHEGFLPRNGRETRHYNWQTLLPCIRALGIIFNGHDIKPTARLMRLTDNWNTAGSLIDVKEDMEASKLFQLPLDSIAANEIAGVDSDARQILLKQYFDPQQFYKEKAKAVKGLIDNLGAFIELDIPAWQKCLCTLYMFRAITKVQTKAQYPSFSSES